MKLPFTLFGINNGFGKLVKSFEARPFPPGGKILKTTIQVGPIRYRQCTFITLGTDGIYLKVSYFFKEFPTIFISWNSVKTTRKTSLYGLPANQFDFFDENNPSVRIYETDVEKVKV